MFIKTVI